MGSTTSGNVGAPLVNIRTTTYGVKVDGQYFPKCTPDQINEDNGHNGKWNAVCAKGSLVASGSVQAALTSPSAKLAGPGAPCSLGLCGLQRRRRQADVLLHDYQSAVRRPHHGRRGRVDGHRDRGRQDARHQRARAG